MKKLEQFPELFFYTEFTNIRQLTTENLLKEA
jgi:hypothetical protein